MAHGELTGEARQQRTEVSFSPENEILVIKTWPDRFTVAPHETFIPFAMLDQLYHAALGMRIAKAAQQTQAPGSPVTGLVVKPH